MGDVLPQNKRSPERDVVQTSTERFQRDMQRFVLPAGSQTGEKTPLVECHLHSGGRKNHGQTGQKVCET